jgi:hypothetical protein
VVVGGGNCTESSTHNESHYSPAHTFARALCAPCQVTKQGLMDACSAKVNSCSSEVWTHECAVAYGKSLTARVQHNTARHLHTPVI